MASGPLDEPRRYGVDLVGDERHPGCPIPHRPGRASNRAREVASSAPRRSRRRAGISWRYRALVGVGQAGHHRRPGAAWPAYTGLRIIMSRREMVLADGSSVRADATTLPDLFWAVRGAGSNFGVVTAFEIAASPVSVVGYAEFVLVATTRPSCSGRLDSAGVPRPTGRRLADPWTIATGVTGSSRRSTPSWTSSGARRRSVQLSRTISRIGAGSLPALRAGRPYPGA